MILLVMVALLATNAVWLVLLAVGRLQWSHRYKDTPVCQSCPLAVQSCQAMRVRPSLEPISVLAEPVRTF